MFNFSGLTIGLLIGVLTGGIIAIHVAEENPKSALIIQITAMIVGGAHGQTYDDRFK